MPVGYDRHRRDVGGERWGDRASAGGSLAPRRPLIWAVVQLWRAVWWLFHRTLYGALGNPVGRIGTFLVAVWTLGHTTFGAPVPFVEYLPLAVPVALVGGALAYWKRRVWESRVANAVYHDIPGHSVREPEVVWFGNRLNAGRWTGSWNFGFRVPPSVSDRDRHEVESLLRDRLPAAAGASWGFTWDWRGGKAKASLIQDLPSGTDEPLRKAEEAAPATGAAVVQKNTEASEKAATKIPLGKSREAEIVWDCSNLFGCILIAGAPGGGKSVVTLTILSHCFAHRTWWKVYGIDLKRVELGPLRRFAPDPVVSVATDLDAAIEVLQEVQENMEARYQLMENEGHNNIRKLNNARRSRGEKHLPHIMVAMDEIAELVEEQGGRDNKEEDEKRTACKKRINSIVRLGRASGVHMILATQRPDAEYIPGSTKSNIQARVALGGLSKTGSEMTIEDPAASNLPGVAGRGIWFQSGQLTEMQGYLTEDDDLDAALSGTS